MFAFSAPLITAAWLMQTAPATAPPAVPPGPAAKAPAAAATPVKKGAPAARPPGHLMFRCIEILPGKGDEYRDFMLATTAKSMQVRADEGDLDGWVFASAVIPAGNDTACGYIQINVYKHRFPPERTPIDPYFVKAGVKVTRAEWYAKLGSQSKLARQELWRDLLDVGAIEKGNYLRLDYLRVPPGKTAEWARLARDVVRPVEEARIAAGELKAWQLQEIVLPAGTGYPYNGRVISAFPSWEALGKPTPDHERELYSKAHPGKQPAALIDRAAKAQELVKSELYRVVEVVRPATRQP
jgi:hypothetical protein